MLVAFIQLFNQVTGEGSTLKTEINRLERQAFFDLTTLAILRFGGTRCKAAFTSVFLP
jgi:hypothetical protein